MAEYKKWELTVGWRRQHVSGMKCKACGVPTAELNEAYVCCISRHRGLYSVLCVPCFQKRVAKKTGDPKDSGMNPYTISDVMKACRALRMKILVEEAGSELVKQLEHKMKYGESKDNYRHSSNNPLASMIHNFPHGLSLMSAGALKGGGRDPGSLEAHRMELFVSLAKRLRPFLRQVTGMMLNRLFMANREQMKKKYTERQANIAWRQHVAQTPARLFPVTATSVHTAEMLMNLIPHGASATAIRYDSDSEMEAKKHLGIDSNRSGYVHDLEIEVFNTPKGPRFIIRHNRDKEGK